MLIKSKYEYPILERVDLEIGRHYLDSKIEACSKCYNCIIWDIKIKRWTHSVEK